MGEMKSLSREEDVQITKKAMEQPPSWFIGIPDKKTPWYFINLDYADGYVHWYDIGGGARRVVCAGGLEGKGFATEECPICAYVLELYQDAKRLKQEGEDAKAKQLKDRANNLRAGPEVQFKAIRGQRTLLKTRAGKKWIADWDMEDEDTTVAVGVISLSTSQFDGLTAMINGEKTKFIESGDDLGNRILWTAKERRKGRTGGKYSAVVWEADEQESPMPDLEIDEELLNMDLTENFVIEVEQVEKIYSLLSGQEIETVADDESVAMEEDSAKEPENADLDDLPDDEDPDAEGETEEEDFVDDLPWEKDGEEEKPKSVRRTTVRKETATPRKKTAVQKKAAPKNGRRKKAVAAPKKKASKKAATPKKPAPGNGRRARGRSGKARM